VRPGRTGPAGNTESDTGYGGPHPSRAFTQLWEHGLFLDAAEQVVERDHPTFDHLVMGD
jgi:hypothetical protein